MKRSKSNNGLPHKLRKVVVDKNAVDKNQARNNLSNFPNPNITNGSKQIKKATRGISKISITERKKDKDIAIQLANNIGVN